jgi:6-phosphogluconate dehydrogenase
MKSVLGMSAAAMQRVFAAWNEGEMNSYLIEITAAVLARLDPETGKPLVEVILDKAGQKGTGKWTSQNALDLGIAIPTINAALEARILSAFKDERLAASKVLGGPAAGVPAGDTSTQLASLQGALRLAILTCYAQGFALMREASKEYGYNLDLREIARIWKGGCIIRARVLDSIRAAFAARPELPNLLVAEPFSALANELQDRLRSSVSTAVENGVPVLALAASLGYLDSYRRPTLPANLLQAQRDYFGAHKYERIDKPRGQQFHTEWVS